MRDVAVMMCEEPAVKDVYRNRRGSSSSSLRLTGAAMVGGNYCSRSGTALAVKCSSRAGFKAARRGRHGKIE